MKTVTRGRYRVKSVSSKSDGALAAFLDCASNRGDRGIQITITRADLKNFAESIGKLVRVTIEIEDGE